MFIRHSGAALVAVVLSQLYTVIEGSRLRDVAEGFPYSPDQQDVVDERVGLCVNPDDPSVLNTSRAWDELVWSKFNRNDILFGVDGWSNYPFGNNKLPLHMIVGLLRDDSKYTEKPAKDFAMHHNLGLDAACFDFDYEQEDGPDLAGCRVFAKSFKPLQQLRSCIVEQLDQDLIWSQRESTNIIEGEFSGPYREWCRQSVWTYLKFGVGKASVKFPAKLCSQFDSKRRAQEMIKMVLFKPVPDNVDEATELIDRKVCRTVTWPQHKEAPPCLQASTVATIRSQCFKVQESKPLDGAKFLGKISPCLPLMFDKVEIQGFGMGDAMTKFQDEDYYGNPGQNLVQSYIQQVPAVCGRLALAAIPKFQTARYTLTSVSGMFQDMTGLDTKPRWSDCMDVKETNCRKMYFCWEKAMRRMCKWSPNCCPGVTKRERLLAQETCVKHPNSGACPESFRTYSGGGLKKAA
jgi:hypothetical protein